MVAIRGPREDISKSTHRSIESENAAKNSQRYTMEVVLQPPSRSRPGQVLRPPIVVELKDQRLIDRIGSPNMDAKHLFACASVVSEDGLVALAPPHPNLLQGGFSDSIHPGFNREGQEQGYYFRFTDLQIHEAGKYRIRILLVKMPTSGRSSAAVNLESVVTRVIHVDKNATAPSLEPAERNTLKLLQSRNVLKKEEGGN